MMEGDFFVNLVKDSNLLVKKLGIIFPPSLNGVHWLYQIIFNLTGLMNLLTFIVVGIISFLIMLFLSGPYSLTD